MNNTVYLSISLIAMVLACLAAPTILLAFRRRRARFSARRADAVSVLEDFERKLEQSAKLMARLDNNYLGFLHESTHYLSRFSGETARLLSAAVAHYADFTVLHEAARRRCREARTAFEQIEGCDISAVEAVISMLTIEIVTVSADELPLDKVDLFGELVKKVEVDPGALLDSMSSSFRSANQGLAGVLKAVERVRSRKDTMREQVAILPTCLEPLRLAGFSEQSQTTYLSRISSIQAACDEMASLPSSDPIACGNLFDRMQSRIEQLHQDIQRAIDLRRDILALDTKIAGAVYSITRVRTTLAEYAYPVPREELPTEPRQPQLYRLDEPGANPDELIERARRQKELSLELLDSGKLDEAQSTRLEAASTVEEALERVDSVIAAKSFVEAEAGEAASQIMSLHKLFQANVESADEALSALPIAARVGDKAGEKAGDSVSRRVMKVLLAYKGYVRSEYDAQHYVAAGKRLSMLKQSISSCFETLRAQERNIDKLIPRVKGSAVLLEERAAELEKSLEACTAPLPKELRLEVESLVGEAKAMAAVEIRRIGTVLNSRLEKEAVVLSRAVELLVTLAETKKKQKQALGRINSLPEHVSKIEVKLTQVVRQSTMDRFDSLKSEGEEIKEAMEYGTAGDWHAFLDRVDDLYLRLTELVRVIELDKQEHGQAANALAKAREVKGQRRARALAEAWELMNSAQEAFERKDYERANTDARRAIEMVREFDQKKGQNSYFWKRFRLD